MKVTCEVCGKGFEAKTKRARYCGGSCRMKASRGGLSTPRQPATVTPLPGPFAGVAEQTEKDLKGAGRLDTWQGQAALALAQRIERAVVDTGASYASLVREHRAAMEKALLGVGAPGSVVSQDRDELAEWRKKRGGGA